MVHVCIYDNVVDAGGYRIHDKSANFPHQYETEILRVSECFGAGDGEEETVAIRYTPLRNDKYLLSWILRHPVVFMEGQRAWHTVVHFLMDGEDADALFHYPISQIVQRVKEKADWLNRNREAIQTYRDPLFSKGEKPSPESEGGGNIYDTIMMAGVSYCASTEIKNQLFLEAEDPYGEMDVIRQWLPHALHKKLSFCIGLENLQESTNAVFNFPLKISLSQLRNAPCESVPVTNKYWLGEKFPDADLLKRCDQILTQLNKHPWLQKMVFSSVSEWEELEYLADNNFSRGLSKLIEKTGVDNWIHMVGTQDMDSRELQEFVDLIKKSRKLKKLYDAIRKKSKKTFHGKHVLINNKSDTSKVQHSEDHDALRKILVNHARNALSVVLLAVVLIALITLFRQTLVKSEVEVEQLVYYCISREAAVDLFKLIGAFICGIFATLAGMKLFGKLR